MLKERAIFSAAAHAQRAADFLHGLQPQRHAEMEDDEAADFAQDDLVAA